MRKSVTAEVTRPATTEETKARASALAARPCLVIS